MSRACYVATRKGLFTVARGASGWAVSRANFLGDNCTLTMHDPRSGDVIAALYHGHFGAKLHRSRDEGGTWQEIGTPAYPPMPDGYTPKMTHNGKPIDWALKLVWALAPGGTNERGVIWCGTMPGGLFRSDDGGDSWTLNRQLWDDPKREMWFGGGADYPGIHSVCVDPRDPKHIVIGISCGGAWVTRDGGCTWSVGGKGCARNTCRRKCSSSRTLRIRIRWCSARRIRTRYGCSTITGYSNRPIVRHRGARFSRAARSLRVHD